MIVNNFNDANLIACKINSEDEFNKIKKILLNSDYEIDFSYNVYICSIQIRTVSKRVTYGTGTIRSNYEDWFKMELPHILNNHDVFLIEYYEELYKYFNPINIHNYFNNKNVYENNKIIINYKLFKESLLNNLNDYSEGI